MGSSGINRVHGDSIVEYTDKMVHRVLELYTSNISTTQKAKFWTDFVSSLKGEQELRARDFEIEQYPPYKEEFVKSQVYRAWSQPILSNPGLEEYAPIHRDIYGYGRRRPFQNQQPQVQVLFSVKGDHINK